MNDRVLSGPMSGNAYYTGQIVALYTEGLALVRDDDDGRNYTRSVHILTKGQ